MTASIIFFDIDETLLDQRRAEAAAATRFFKVHGERLKALDSAARLCRRWRALREKHAADFLAGRITLREQRRRRIRELFAGERVSDRQADERFDLYLEHYRENWSLFDDVLPCMAALEGMRLGVISNGSAHQQRNKLRCTAIEERFEVVLISEEAGCAKPLAGIFHAACRRARLDPRRCVYVGDRLEGDARASRAAGMRGVWLNRRGTAGHPSIPTVHNLAAFAAEVLDAGASRA